MLIRQFCLFASILFVSASAAILGIDLGQDFTKAVLVAPGIPFEIVMSADSKRKDVSGIAFKSLSKKSDDIERIYGSATNSYCTRFPKSCALNYKPLLGKSIEDYSVQEYLKSHSGVELIPSRNNRSTITFNIENNKYPIEELLAMNIQNIVSRASTLLKEKTPGGYSQINDVAFTVPSYFTLAQRNAIKDAAELAGLNVISLIDDGLAIAINYATKTELPVGKQYHIIYDMGAGSTTATLVSFEKLDETNPLNITVEGYSYDDSLGGQVFTDIIANFVEEKFLEKHKEISTTDFKSNSRSIAKIYQSSEKAKLILSANTEASISIESIYDEIDFKTKITRDEFEELLSEYSQRITNPILKSLENSNIKLDEVKSVIFAGGSQRVPFVQKHLISLIGSESISKTVNADEAAVFGATLRAVQISKMFKAKEYNVTDFSIYDYSVKLNSTEDSLNIFPINSTYGVTKEIDLTEESLKDDGLLLTLTENYKSFSNHYTTKLDDIKSKFIFNESDCVGGVKYVGQFSLTESRIFQLNYLEARCEIEVEESSTDAKEPKGFFNKILNSKGEEIKTKVKKSNIPFKTSYISSRPLGTATKQELRAHLQNLNTKDSQRKTISEKLNELESILYKARNYLDTDDVQEKGPSETVEKTSSIVTEFLEWLDYESDDAKLKDIKEKIEKVGTLIKQIEEYMESLSVSLELDEFKELHRQGVLAINSIQESLLNFTEESIEQAKNFSIIGLDYDKEVAKLTKYARSISFETVESTCKEMIAFFENVKILIDETKYSFEDYSREELFQIRKEAVEKLTKVILLEVELKKVHAQRMKELGNVVSRFYKQQKRAALKAKAKEEEEALKKAKETAKEDKDKDEEFDNEFEETIIEAETETNKHDEL